MPLIFSYIYKVLPMLMSPELMHVDGVFVCSHVTVKET